MKDAKCTHCGANIEVDENEEVGTCPYCKANYAVEKAIKQYNSSTTNNANVINNYYSSNQDVKIRVPKKQRPKINVRLFLVLLLFGIFPGVIYFTLVKVSQKKWDDKYSY